MKKKLILIIILNLSITQIYAQSYSMPLRVIASAGDVVKSTNIILGYTIGEVAIDNVKATNSISEGFWQKGLAYNLTNTIELDGKVFKLNIFPNPTNDLLKISFDQVLTSDIQYSVYDILGNTVLSNRITEGDYLEDIELSNWTPGLYILRLSTAKGDLLSSSIITKL
jgi:Secretion system C-terminal sorting domain